MTLKSITNDGSSECPHSDNLALLCLVARPFGPRKCSTETHTCLQSWKLSWGSWGFECGFKSNQINVACHPSAICSATFQIMWRWIYYYIQTHTHTQTYFSFQKGQWNSLTIELQSHTLFYKAHSSYSSILEVGTKNQMEQNYVVVFLKVFYYWSVYRLL